VLTQAGARGMVFEVWTMLAQAGCATQSPACKQNLKLKEYTPWLQFSRWLAGKEPPQIQIEHLLMLSQESA